VLSATVAVYPNPAENATTLSIITQRSGEKTEIRLYDLLGNLLWSNSIKLPAGLYHQDIDLKEYSPGIYFIEVKNGDQSIVNKLEKL
ncbi:MAG: T9SS type A sorting domain-containing protein, partial [Chitinophagales bacterium]